jgi:signal peptidase I
VTKTSLNMPEQVSPAPRQHSRIRRGFYIAFLIFAAIMIYLFAFVGVTPFKVPTGSMIPTLLPGDFLFCAPQQEYQRGDLVVVDDPLRPGGYLVKRIVGLPGDTVAAENGYLALNESYASEPYLREPMNYEMPPRTVPEGEIFLLGDNRNESDDASRWLIDPESGDAIETEQAGVDVVGDKIWKRTLPIDSIVGKVVYLYLPFDRMGPVRSYPLTNLEGK